MQAETASMGKAISSFVKRPAQNWNIENRAQRHLEKQEKPIPAPKHPSTKQLIDSFNKEHPEIREQQLTKDENLSKMLKGLVVNPERMGQFASPQSKKGLLPLDRSKFQENEFGYTEPEVIRPGRCSIRQVLQFLGDHFTDPTGTTAETIAQKYNLDKARVEVVLKHFYVFNVQIPGQQTKESTDITLKPGFFVSKKSLPDETTKSDSSVSSKAQKE